MDGNGRWAQLRNKPRTYGHVKGTRVAKKIITRCSKLGIQSLTLYAFSTENWMRPQSEVAFLMALLRKYLLREADNLVKENIRFTTIGEEKNLPLDILEAIAMAKEKTKSCTGLHLVFALSYGSKQELTNAIKKIARMVENNEISEKNIDEKFISSQLQTAGTLDPDLIIRTSGEQRLSNFLLWQAAYSEFYFTSILWPDFTESSLDEAFNNYHQRQRRFGKVIIKNEQLHR